MVTKKLEKQWTHYITFLTQEDAVRHLNSDDTNFLLLLLNVDELSFEQSRRLTRLYHKIEDKLG